LFDHAGKQVTFRVNGSRFKVNKPVLWAVIFIVAALYGTLLEWAVGHFWNLVGECPYEYPGSSLTYTSFIMMPMWGLAGLQAVVIYRAIRHKRPSLLLWLLGLLVLTVVMVVILAQV